MELKIKDIIDKYKGEKCIVVGHGPSLDLYSDKLCQYKDEGYRIIGCNNWNEFYLHCPPHYWLMANNVDNSKNLLNIINTHKSVWVYADTVDLTDKKWIDENFKTDYLAYDQRHFGGKKCVACERHKCSTYFDPDRLTIQEELQRYTNFDKHYGYGHTVAMHMLAFSVLMGFSEIYIIGLDFDYRIGYAKNSTNRTVPAHDFEYFQETRYGGEILDDVRVIYESAKNIGTKMYNLNKNSSWNILEFKNLT